LDPQGKIAAATSQMRGEIARGSATLAGALPKPGDRNVQQIARYLLATREVLHGEPKAGDARYSAGSEPIVIDDFESGTLDKWTSEGHAIARTSAVSEDRQHPRTGFQGRHLINS